MASLALIVEDDEDIATIFAEAARAAGYEPDIVRSGEGALLYLATVAPALVILDLHLPGLPGTDVLDWIRAHPPLVGTRVIVATADSRLADTLHEVADLVLLKPIDFRQLRDLAVRLGSPRLAGG